jgi:hypothetical protein
MQIMNDNSSCQRNNMQFQLEYILNLLLLFIDCEENNPSAQYAIAIIILDMTDNMFVITEFIIRYITNNEDNITFFHVHTVHLDNYQSFFHQLKHSRIVLKIILNLH